MLIILKIYMFLQFQLWKLYLNIKIDDPILKIAIWIHFKIIIS
jgi:hypothetical protein